MNLPHQRIRPGIEQWLKLLQSWLRDALLIQQNATLPIVRR